MDLATLGAMVISEGHSTATMQVVAPPADPRSTETPIWNSEVQGLTDQAFAEYRVEAEAAGKPEVNLAHTLLVVSAGAAALQHLVHDGRPEPRAEEDDDDEEQMRAEDEKTEQ